MPCKTIIAIVGLCAGIVICCSLFFAPVDEMKHGDLLAAIELAAGYMHNAIEPNGQFTYRISLYPGAMPRPKYNILRHAGAIYALATYAHQYPQRGNAAKLKRAVHFLKRNIAPIRESDDFLAVWSVPTINKTRKPLQAKLGGTGLGLVALLSMEKIYPGTTRVDFLRKLGNFLIFMQKDNGSFYSKYIPAKGGRCDKWVSLYYPGEAALGLLLLYEKDPLPRWLNAASAAIAYLARMRAGKTIVEADHWALLATAKLLPLICKSAALSRRTLLDHASQIAHSILAAKNSIPKHSLAHGCFTKDGRTCPTATRIEGLIAVRRLLPNLRSRIDRSTAAAMKFLLRAQVKQGKFAGAIPRKIHGQSVDARSDEVRIDYVQHALSAMLQCEAEFFCVSEEERDDEN